MQFNSFIGPSFTLFHRKLLPTKITKYPELLLRRLESELNEWAKTIWQKLECFFNLKHTVDTVLWCWPSLPESGYVVYLKLDLHVWKIFNHQENHTVINSSSQLFVSAVMSFVGNPDGSFGEQRSPYSVCQLDGRMWPFATQPTDRATILYWPLPWPPPKKPSKERLKCSYPKMVYSWRTRALISWTYPIQKKDDDLSLVPHKFYLLMQLSCPLVFRGGHDPVRRAFLLNP